jgi:predicted kinase
MPKLYMLIGVPGSGKSTWFSNYVKEVTKGPHNTALASSDMYIELLARSRGKTYNEVFQDVIKEAEKAMYESVMEAVADNADIVWDQTNLNRKTRAKKLIMIPDHYQKIAIYFPTPDDLDARLASRPGKTIPEHVMKSMISSLEFPQYDEGFDVIYDVNTYNDRFKLYEGMNNGT